MTVIDFSRTLSRGTWGARSAGPLTAQASPIEAFIHHSADSNARLINTMEEQKRHMKQIQNFHMDSRGWSDIGYHYVIFQHIGEEELARIFQGRRASAVPAAQAGHNTRTLAICVVGDGRRDPLYRNTRYAIEQIIRSYPSVGAVGGHRDVTSTECPGDKFMAAIPRIAKAVNRNVYSGDR